MPAKIKPQRLDIVLTTRGLVESRALAQRLIMAGQVRVDGQMVLKPSVLVAETVSLEVIQGPPYVSRGGEKLAGAFEVFNLDVSGLVCADVGASTGGFTDCLLQNGAAKVYAIDVGSGILHWKIRQDSRVVVMEGTNARYVEHLPETVSFITVDVSFISLKTILPVVKGWFGQAGGTIIALIKPQFEAGREEVARGDGVIRDRNVHRRILDEVLQFAIQEEFGPRGLVRSPLVGPKGNVEFLAWFEYPALATSSTSELISKVV